MSRVPEFLRKRVPKQKNIRRLRGLINNRRIHTVCESAKCPNIGECFSQKTLTFMILGDTCTRRCRFCAVNQGHPQSLDPNEAKDIAAAVQQLGLDYVVVTSVTRDDLPDGGAGQFADVIRTLRAGNVALRIEVLIPDFQGNEAALNTVLEAKPTVLNHNIETVPRLYPKVRPQADYQRSLQLLARAACADSGRGIYTKSGFMVGLGESRDEVFQVVKDLHNAGCDIVTIGQYLAPSKAQVQVERYLHPDEFRDFQTFGQKLGLKVIAGPFVRSSYHAKDAAGELK